MKLVSSLALAWFVATATTTTTTDAFGPATPLMRPFGGSSSSSSANKIANNNNKNDAMTMRVGTSDLGRRQKFNQILQTVGVIGTPTAVQETLLSPETSTLISKMNWKVQKKVMRKVKNMAERQVLVVDSDFGRM
jgi:hypothetical protein